MSLTLTAKNNEYTLHPDGIHPAICVDVIDLGLQKQEFQGQPAKMVQKIKVVFETEEKGADGKCLTISKNFTASLHPKATLNKFLSQWRGKPVATGENIDLAKLVGAGCTLVISHQKSELSGKEYAAIDAVSKPTKKLKPSGAYDPEATRQRIAEWQAKQANGGQAAPVKSSAAQPAAKEEDQIPMGNSESVDPEVGF